MEHLANDHKDRPNLHENSYKHCDETGYPVMNIMESQWRLKQQHDQNWRESHCRTNTSVRRKKLIQKTRTVRITVWDLSGKVNCLSKVLWDRKIITEFTRSSSFTKIGKPVLMMDVKFSKDKHICRWIDWENLVYVRWNRFKNFA